MIAHIPAKDKAKLRLFSAWPPPCLLACASAAARATTQILITRLRVHRSFCQVVNLEICWSPCTIFETQEVTSPVICWFTLLHLALTNTSSLQRKNLDKTFEALRLSFPFWISWAFPVSCPGCLPAQLQHHQPHPYAFSCSYHHLAS